MEALANVLNAEEIEELVIMLYQYQIVYVQMVINIYIMFNLIKKGFFDDY